MDSDGDANRHTDCYCDFDQHADIYVHTNGYCDGYFNADAGRLYQPAWPARSALAGRRRDGDSTPGLARLVRCELRDGLRGCHP